MTDAEKAAEAHINKLQDGHPQYCGMERDIKRDFLAGYAAAMQWRGIESAPRDGTAIIMLLDGSDIPHSVRWICNGEIPGIDEDGWYMVWDHYHLGSADIPTGWLPLPPSE